MRLRVVAFILGTIFILCATQGSAMSFFGKKQEVVIASPLKGKITLEGRPIVGAKVERLLKWKGTEEQAQEAYTDSGGDFAFPEVIEELELNPLATMVRSQDLSVVYQGERKAVLSTATHRHSLFSEFGGEPKGFVCELTRDDVPVRKDGALILTSCTWEGYQD